MITELNERSREIFRIIVDSYLESGEPVGSRTISKMRGMSLSPASIRNVMKDLEEAGLLYAPHTSAGRLPTQQGLRFYVDGLMEIGRISGEERMRIDAECRSAGKSMKDVYERAGAILSGLSSCAGLVVAPKADKPVKHIQFVALDGDRTLVILVTEDGLVENRIMDSPGGVPPSSLVAAGNYLNERVRGRTLSDAQTGIAQDIRAGRTRLDAIAQDLVEKGIALPSSHPQQGGLIVIRGQSRLLDDVRAIEELERARHLMEMLEEQETMMRLLESAREAEGVQIFIGTENRVFDHSGWSMVISPYKSGEGQIIGAIGVIGPTRLNYGRVVPIVDYTSKAMARILGGGRDL